MKSLIGGVKYAEKYGCEKSRPLVEEGRLLKRVDKDYWITIFCPCEMTTPLAEEALTRCPARLNTALGAVGCSVIPFTFERISGSRNERTVGAGVPSGRVKKARLRGMSM